MPASLDLLCQYRRLLAAVDAWFAGCLQHTGAHIRCAEGCSACCRGLFDITLLDALLLQEGLRTLSPAVQEAVRFKAKGFLPVLRRRWPGFAAPYLLNTRPAAEWPRLLDAADEVPCALLDAAGACRIYPFRPLTCRLHGLPLVDRSGEIFEEQWCTRNFTGVDPLALEKLRGDFRDLFSEEVRLLRRLALHLTGRPLAELDTLIPCALLVDSGAYEGCL